MLNSFYLLRGNSLFRKMKDEYQFAKYLFNKHGILSVDLSRLDIIQQHSLLSSSNLVIFVAGSAGLALVNCPCSCQVIEISPQTIFLSDVERQDSYSRGGGYTIYVSDSQSKEISETGDPLWVDIDYGRMSGVISTISEQSRSNQWLSSILL